jgi:hypothetical protein
MIAKSIARQGIGISALSVAFQGFKSAIVVETVVRLTKPIPRRMPLSFHQGTRFLLNNQFTK